MRQQHFSESVILMWLIPRFPLFLASLKESALRKGRGREDLARCLCSSHERAGANWPWSVGGGVAWHVVSVGAMTKLAGNTV